MKHLPNHHWCDLQEGEGNTCFCNKNKPSFLCQSLSHLVNDSKSGHWQDSEGWVPLSQFLLVTSSFSLVAFLVTQDQDLLEP